MIALKGVEFVRVGYRLVNPAHVTHITSRSNGGCVLHMTSGAQLPTEGVTLDEAAASLVGQDAEWEEQS